MEEKQKINGWKWAFILLAILIAGILLYFYLLAVSTSEGQVNTEPVLADESMMQFELSSDKRNLSQLVNLYLEEETEDDFVGYRFILDEQAELHGEFEVFNLTAGFSLYLEPQVLDNGNILFRAEELSLGALELPVGIVMSQVDRQVDLPDFIVINSQEQIIAVNLNEFELENGMRFSVNEINLHQDNISLNIYLPPDALQ